MDTTRTCPICFSSFPIPKEAGNKNKRFCGRHCANKGISRESADKRRKFIGGWELFEEAERLYSPHGGRVQHIMKAMNCSESLVHKMKAKLKFQWKEEYTRKSCSTGHAARAYARAYGECAICGDDRFVEAAHWWPAKHGGTGTPINIIPLCPTHHRCYDRNLLTKNEKKKLTIFLYLKHPVIFHFPHMAKVLLQKHETFIPPPAARIKAKKRASVSN